MVMLGSYPGGGTSRYDGESAPELLGRYSEDVGDLGVDTSSLLKAAGQAAGSLLSGGKSRSSGTAQAVPGGGFNPQLILANEEKLRQQGLKTCMSIMKDASGNVIGISPRQRPLNEPCPEGMVDATTFATGGGVAGGAAALTPSQPSYTPPAQPSPESTMTYPSPESTPWYKKWWVWTLILGGTATVGVGGYLIYRKSQAAPAAAGLGAFRPRGCLCGRR